MATRTLRVCDFGQGACVQVAIEYRVWRDGDRQAWTLDLCDEHAAPLLGIVEGADRSDLPARTRVKMEPTPLHTTEKTRPHKK